MQSPTLLRRPAGFHPAAVGSDGSDRGNGVVAFHTPQSKVRRTASSPPAPQFGDDLTPFPPSQPAPLVATTPPPATDPTASPTQGTSGTAAAAARPPPAADAISDAGAWAAGWNAGMAARAASPLAPTEPLLSPRGSPGSVDTSETLPLAGGATPVGKDEATTATAAAALGEEARGDEEAAGHAQPAGGPGGLALGVPTDADAAAGCAQPQPVYVHADADAKGATMPGGVSSPGRHAVGTQTWGTPKSDDSGESGGPSGDITLVGRFE